MSDEQDRAEAVDEDELRIGDGYDDDPAHDLNDPPIRAVGVHEYGLTSAEEEWDEPLEERVRREEPDPLVEELDHDPDPSVLEDSAEEELAEEREDAADRDG